MSRNEAGKNYLEAEVRTASPVRLVVLVCDFGIDRLKRAVEAMKSDPPKPEEFLVHTGKAREAVTELMSAVTPERAPEISNNLIALYGYFFKKITNARAGSDAAPLEEVIRLWEQLREGWAIILKQGVSGPVGTDAKGAGKLVSVTG